MTLPDHLLQTARPVLFTPDMEVVPEDEIDIISDLISTLRSLMETASAHHGRAVRAVHAKSHGIVRGELAVLEDLDPVLRQGVFATPRVYPVLMRFSTHPGDLGDDEVPVPRGLALKIVGVEGPRLPGAASGRTQDFVLADGPAFCTPDAGALLHSLRQAAASDRPPLAGPDGCAPFGGIEALIDARGGEGATAPDGAASTHILASPFFSQAPTLFGPYVAKFQVAPVGPELLSLKEERIVVKGRPDALREAVEDFFESQSGTFELRAQLLTNTETMPVEDASAVWPEAESPYRTLARITVPPQPVWDAARSEGAEESLSFSPWHGLAAHRPLGSIMRARRPSYDMSASFRAARNGCPIHNPRSEADLPL